MAKFFENLLTGASNAVTGGLSSGLSGAIGGLFGMIGQGKREQRQLDMQKELNEQAAALNYEYGEKAAQNAFERQMQMYERSYKDQSYAAMRKQMEEAGLSVGLMYGGGASGGQGGATSGAPQGETGGAQAGQAANVAERTNAMTQQAMLGLQMRNLEQDIEVKKSAQEKNEADAEAARANAGLTTEKKITEIQAREPMIENLRSDLKTKNMQRIMMDVDTRIKKIEFEIAEGTKEAEIETVKLNVGKMKNDIVRGITEIDGMQIDNEIKNRSKEDIINTYNAKLKNIIKDTLLKDAQIDCTEEQANMFAESAYNQYMQAETIDDKMANEYEIAELMAKAGMAQSKIGSSAHLGGSLLQMLGLLTIGFAKLPGPNRPIGFGKN